MQMSGANFQRDTYRRVGGQQADQSHQTLIQQSSLWLPALVLRGRRGNGELDMVDFMSSLEQALMSREADCGGQGTSSDHPQAEPGTWSFDLKRPSAHEVPLTRYHSLGRV